MKETLSGSTRMPQKTGNSGGRWAEATVEVVWRSQNVCVFS